MATADADAGDAATRVYVGNLKPKANETHLTEAFARFGAIANVWVARKPPGFAFVQFERSSDALRAVRSFDDARPLEILGKRVKVQMAGDKAKETSKPTMSDKDHQGRRRSPSRSRSPVRRRPTRRSSSIEPSRRRQRHRSSSSPQDDRSRRSKRSRSRSHPRSRSRSKSYSYSRSSSRSRSRSSSRRSRSPVSRYRHHRRDRS